ncbi:mono [ADP-ribose] polymerase PARP16-like isoform X2 [Dinothrombium tinctorium]|uniref:Mono [ADP-ribose] polymerase PARP16-like isoform X2 n=1 Tax=Dinothrombium tinctorium TaxID=1965070 RepID=A0A3S3S9Y8_9ACAR|nr:mono [ADP-ribose] polymerase PARP16-like isoform X2 [Dinothrombium tinctorium]RWS11174.1 mono [ADP-ribose] polymerase PARP16-like isoform X2 [Dinothrombium tinctorium]RWS11277.1 mono [ADP-ribose] polymerase PARP16-like isoform X2 [Dinothrombium tinctorium]
MNENRDANDYKTQVMNLIKKRSPHYLISLDLKLTLFASSLLSYRRETLSKPFPTFLIENDEKQYDLTNDCLQSIPKLCDINESTKMPYLSWRLLHWILNHSSVELELTDCDETINNILGDSQSIRRFKPNYIFKVMSKPKEAFVRDKQLYGSFFAFHGSRLENFHSIIYNGLINCLNKRDLFGSGTYLSSKIDVAVEFSPFGLCFNRSLFGHKLSCVALCEVIKSPKIVDQSNSSLPNSYYVITNDDHIRVSYILVYSLRFVELYRNFITKIDYKLGLSHY